jgi:hypothetical protein
MDFFDQGMPFTPLYQRVTSLISLSWLYLYAWVGDSYDSISHITWQKFLSVLCFQKLCCSFPVVFGNHKWVLRCMMKLFLKKIVPHCFVCLTAYWLYCIPKFILNFIFIMYFVVTLWFFNMPIIVLWLELIKNIFLKGFSVVSMEQI